MNASPTTPPAATPSPGTPSPGETSRLSKRFSQMQRRPGLVFVILGAITALLVVPFLTMAPDGSASTEPTGDVFTARDLIDDNFASSVRLITFVTQTAETAADEAASDGDLLRAAPMQALAAAAETLRTDPEVGPTLLSYYSSDLDRDVVGIATIADLIDEELRTDDHPGLAAASDAEVKAAGATIIDRYGARNNLLGLSSQSAQDAEGNWQVPAVIVNVAADDNVLGFGATSINIGSDTEPEEYDRSVEELLRTADGLDVYGIAIGVNLTSQEQGAVAGPFIGFTILAVLVLVGATFRSYWILTVVAAALMTLIVWLKGISNLVGLKDDLVLSLIVPVAMISFGVDFAFHAIGRYREQRTEGMRSPAAFVTGLTAVTGALVLALVSDSVAFLANLTSGIESINQFGFGAAIALVSAFVLLGVAAPLAVATIEASVPPPTSGRRATALRIAGSFGAAAMTMGSVLLMVFVLPWLGTILAALTIAVTLLVPLAIRRRRLTADAPAVGDLDVAAAESSLAARLGRAVAAVSRRPIVVISTAVAVTGVAAVFAVQVPAEFDVEDFFAADTDFVVGLDLINEHLGDRGGEPASLYIEGDLTDPAALQALAGHVERLQTLDTPALARDDAGMVEMSTGVFEVFDATFDSPVMAGIVAEQTGVEITDVDGDRIPDDRGQVEALLTVASQIGVPLDAERQLLTPDDVNTVVAISPAATESSAPAATVLELQIPNSRSQDVVTAAAAELDPIAEAIAADLDGSFVQVTGSAFVREASLDATNRALLVSLPIAVLLCVLVAGAFLRSVRYGIASVIPIVMVVAWLYAVMEIAGFAINLVTATIAAVSIGIGIDFAIHFIARFREELARTGRRDSAIQAAGEGTGLALVASAISSSVGFGILAFAPMPLFASYGLLTAVMIAMALVATLLVLPAILRVITRDATVDDGAAAWDPTMTIDDRGPGALIEV